MHDKSVFSEVIAALRPHVGSHFELDLNTELLGSVAIDSMVIVQLTVDLERRLALKLGAGDLEFDHFATVDTLVRRLSELGTRG